MWSYLCLLQKGVFSLMQFELINLMNADLNLMMAFQLITSATIVCNISDQVICHQDAY